MTCPRCKGGEICVMDSRDVDGETIRRRRACNGCRFRFTTYERIEPIKLTVQKQNGNLEPFLRDKILRGLVLATEKRNIPKDTLELIAEQIEMRLLSDGLDPIPSIRIGDEVSRELKKLDQIAYLRFTSVYRSFDSLEAFEKELAKIKQHPTT